MTDSKDTLTGLFGQKVRVRVCGLLVRDDKLLLVKHTGIGPTGTYYIPPGGGINFGETLHHALIREIQEETGLTVAVEELVSVHEYIEPPLHAIELFFTVREISGQLMTGTDPELTSDTQLIQQVKFYSLSQLAAIPLQELHPVLHTIKDWEELRTRKLLLR